MIPVLLPVFPNSSFLPFGLSAGCVGLFPCKGFLSVEWTMILGVSGGFKIVVVEFSASHGAIILLFALRVVPGNVSLHSLFSLAPEATEITAKSQPFCMIHFIMFCHACRVYHHYTMGALQFLPDLLLMHTFMVGLNDIFSYSSEVTTLFLAPERVIWVMVQLVVLGSFFLAAFLTFFRLVHFLVTVTHVYHQGLAPVSLKVTQVTSVGKDIVVPVVVCLKSLLVWKRFSTFSAEMFFCDSLCVDDPWSDSLFLYGAMRTSVGKSEIEKL